MNKYINAILLSLVLLPAIVLAHPEGHDKPQTIDKQQAMAAASYHVKRLIKKDKLDQSWQSLSADKAEFRRRNSRMTWVVSFTKLNSDDQEKTTLYVFLTNTGYFLATNFDGT